MSDLLRLETIIKMVKNVDPCELVSAAVLEYFRHVPGISWKQQLIIAINIRSSWEKIFPSPQTLMMKTIFIFSNNFSSNSFAFVLKNQHWAPFHENISFVRNLIPLEEQFLRKKKKIKQLFVGLIVGYFQRTYSLSQSLGFTSIKIYTKHVLTFFLCSQSVFRVHVIFNNF